jgi:hypothetical protein
MSEVTLHRLLAGERSPAIRQRARLDLAGELRCAASMILSAGQRLRSAASITAKRNGVAARPS